MIKSPSNALRAMVAMTLWGTAQAQGAPFALQVTGTCHWILSVDGGALPQGAKFTLLDAQEHLVGVLDNPVARVTLPGPGAYHALLAPREAHTHVAVAITNPGDHHPCAAYRFTAQPEGITRLRLMSSCVFQVHPAPIEGAHDRRWTLVLADPIPCQVGPRLAVPVLR